MFKPRLTWWLGAGLCLIVAFSVYKYYSPPAPPKTAAAPIKSLSQLTAEIDRRDPHWTLDAIEARRPNCAPEKNSIAYLMSFQQALAAFVDQDRTNRLERETSVETAVNRQLSVQQYSNLVVQLDENRSLVTNLALLSNMPNGRAQLDWPLNHLQLKMPHLDACRHAIYVLQADFERSIQESRTNDATRRIIAMFNLSAALKDEPAGISQLIRLTIRQTTSELLQRWLAMGEPNNADLVQLRNLIQFERMDNLLLAACRGERALWFRFFESLRSGAMPLADVLAQVSSHSEELPDLALKLGTTLVASELVEDQRFMFDALTRCCDLAKDRWDMHWGQWRAFDAYAVAAREQAQAEKRLGLGVRFLPNLKMVGVSALSDQDRLLLTDVALACELYRRKTHQWPTMLEELCPEYFESEPRFPSSRGGIRVDRAADGIILWDSTGAAFEAVEFDPTKGVSQLKVRCRFPLYDPNYRRLASE